MTTPPADEPNSSEPTPEPGRWAPPERAAAPPVPVSFDKPEPTFDPYRFGAPEHPVPPEYAPPGYTPPPVTAPPPTAQRPTQPGPGYGYPGQGYQQPYNAPPNYAQQYPQPRTGNGRAIAALVLGILAVVLCWLSIFDIVFVVLAIVFGFLGLSDAKRGGTGRGMALTGLICGVVGALAATTLTVVILARIKPCLDNYDRGSSAQQDCIQTKF